MFSCHIFYLNNDIILNSLNPSFKRLNELNFHLNISDIEAQIKNYTFKVKNLLHKSIRIIVILIE